MQTTRPTTEAPLRRSLLFVPGAEPRKLEAARAAGADVVIFDLEDAVAPEQKDAARDHVAAALRAGGFGATEPVVRVNAPGTPYFAADIEAVVAAGARLLMVPKTETGKGVLAVEAALHDLEARLGLGTEDRVRILALVESAAGVLNAADIAGASRRVEALCFGHVDFSLDMGLAEAAPQLGAVHHARCAVALAARARGVAAVDTVCLAVRDDEACRREALEGLGMGYEGKLCIHPRQVPVVNEVFAPTAAQIAFAQEVLAGWEAAQAEGRGVFALRNKMIDAPVVAAQRRLLARARRAGLLPPAGPA